MRLISTQSPMRLRLTRRWIRSKLPECAWIPDVRYISEVNFHHQHRRNFGWMRLDARISFHWQKRRWRTAEECLLQSAGWAVGESEVDPEQAEKTVMAVLVSRYEQHAWLRCWLYSTVGLRLRYDNALDPFWGCGPTGSGQNRLGELHMKYRDDSVPMEYRYLLQPFTHPRRTGVFEV